MYARWRDQNFGIDIERARTRDLRAAVVPASGGGGGYPVW